MIDTPMIGLVIDAMRNIAGRRHRLLRVEVHHALRGEVRHLAAARHDGDGAGHVAGGDAPLDHLRDALQPFGREADVFGFGGGARRDEWADEQGSEQGASGGGLHGGSSGWAVA